MNEYKNSEGYADWTAYHGINRAMVPKVGGIYTDGEHDYMCVSSNVLEKTSLCVRVVDNPGKNTLPVANGYTNPNRIQYFYNDLLTYKGISATKEQILSVIRMISSFFSEKTEVSDLLLDVSVKLQSVIQMMREDALKNADRTI